jgi:hypothetical protein
MIAGGTAGALTTPLDVVKTRVMLEAKASVLQTSADIREKQQASEHHRLRFCPLGLDS